MRPMAVALAAAAMCAAGAATQAPTGSTSSEASLAGGTAINAVLNSSVDSKKAKPGEQITAHTTDAVKSSDGRMILPKGTKLVAHVTQASARSKDQGESMLAIQFDKAVLKDGQEVPLNNVVIQALAAPAREASYGSDMDHMGTQRAPTNNPSMSGSRGARPESTPTAQPYPSANPNGTGGGESSAAGPLPGDARGVYGLEGIRLSANGNGERTVLTSNNKSVHLDGGTRLLLTVQPHSASAALTGK